MEIKFNKLDETLFIYFIGELDQHSASKLRDMLDERIKNENPKSVIFNLTDLTFTDSSGIGLILGRYKKMKTKNIKVYIDNPNPCVRKVFKATGIFSIIPEKKIGGKHE